MDERKSFFFREADSKNLFRLFCNKNNFSFFSSTSSSSGQLHQFMLPIFPQSAVALKHFCAAMK
jgi:hypothetical protein